MFSSETPSILRNPGNSYYHILSDDFLVLRRTARALSTNKAQGTTICRSSPSTASDYRHTSVLGPIPLGRIDEQPPLQAPHSPLSTIVSDPARPLVPWFDGPALRRVLRERDRL